MTRPIQFSGWVKGPAYPRNHPFAPSGTACETLEPRRLLSGGEATAALWNRLVTGTATAADLTQYDLAVVNINGTETYAKAGEWIVKFNLNASRSAQEAVAQLGLGARLKRTLGESDLALIELPRDIDYEQVKARLDRLRLGAYVERNFVIVPTTEERFPYDEFFESYCQILWMNPAT